jgi:succinate dehydrogenase / fumarate reductase cytochrome b subunit
MSATTTHDTHADTAAKGSSSFWNARLGSLLAFMPLGIWTVNHLWDNLAAFSGAQAWEKSVTHYDSPLGMALVQVMVFVPILVHTVWGVKRLSSLKPNYPQYGYFGNLKYILQRLSAVGVLGFLAAHVGKAFIQPRVVHGHAESFNDIAAYMHHHPITLVVYLLGTLGVAYHLANGIWSFAFGWGLVASRPALKRFDVVTIALFGVLLAMSWASIFALYQAGGQPGIQLPAELAADLAKK